MFIPRHPVIENQFCSYAENQSFGTAGVGGVIAYAGSVVYLDASATNEEPMVKKSAHGDTSDPFGLLEQKVKVGYHQVHPAGFSMPGDLGSSDVIAQPYYSNLGAIAGHKSAPVGVAHLGIWDTVHYICDGSGGAHGGLTWPLYVYGTVATKMSPGDPLRPAADQGKLTRDVTNASDATDYDGEYVTGVTTTVARVVKGASIAKCQANIDNTSLFPIRVKLLI